MARIARELQNARVADDVACCAVSHAATARQSWASARLDSLAELECGPAPVLLLVGRAMQSLLAGDGDPRVLAVIDEAAEMREHH
jgi:uroporphyrin-III C-methyltransferase